MLYFQATRTHLAFINYKKNRERIIRSCSQIKSSLNVSKVYMNLQCYNQASPLLMEFITFKLSPISANNKPQETNNSKFQEGTKN
jgi:hypothetical protein